MTSMQVSLRLLWLGYNRLQRLPSEFHRLVNLDWGLNGYTTSLAINGNPLDEPPIEVCRQGVEHIAKYVRSTRRDV